MVRSMSAIDITREIRIEFHQFRHYLFEQLKQMIAVLDRDEKLLEELKMET